MSNILHQKADRAALESKASRDWVDSTFERLDREIREAKSHLLGQEEAFRSAVSQINDDVDGKLDRLELEPLKNYFGKHFHYANNVICPIIVTGCDVIMTYR